MEGLAGGERLEWLIVNLMGRRNARLVGLVRDAIAAGELKVFPPKQLVITMQAAAVGIINLAPLLGASLGIDPYTPEARAAHESMIIDAMLGGLTVGQDRNAP